MIKHAREHFGLPLTTLALDPRGHPATVPDKSLAMKQASGLARVVDCKVGHHIHNRDGKIAVRRSYGNDPPRRKG